MKYEEFKQKYLTPSKSDGRINKIDTLSKNTSRLNKPKVKVSDCKDFEQLQYYWASNYNVKMNEPVKKLDFACVNLVLQGVERVLREFPAAGLYFRELAVNNRAIMSVEEGVMFFNAEWFSQPKALQMAFIEDARSGFHPKNTTLKESGSHEAGHFVEQALIDKRDGEKIRRTHATALVKEAYNRIQSHSNKDLRQLRSEISMYANKNVSECLAEAISDYVANGENAAELSREIWKMLKEELS